MSSITRIGAYGLLEDADSILLCRLSSQVNRWQGWWTLPGGGLEFGEHPETGMIREVEEETGLIVVPESLLGINSFTVERDGDEFHGIQVVYAAAVVSGSLRYELDGTTDMCQWHRRETLADLNVVELVTKALAFQDEANV